MEKKAYENLPLLAINVRTLKFYGFLDYSSPRKGIILAIIPLITDICELLYIYMQWGDLGSEIFNLFRVSILLNSLARMCTIMRNTNKFVELFENLNEWYADEEQNGDVDTLNTIQRIAANAQTLSKCSYAFSAVVGIFVCVYPRLGSERKLVLDVYVPGVDILQSPLYEITYVVQIFSMVPFTIAAYLPFTILFLSSLMFGIGVLQDLQRKLNCLADATNNAVMLREMKACIKYHNRIIRFRDDLEELFKYASLLDVGLFCIMLSMMLFSTSLIDDKALLLMGVGMLLVPFSLVALTYWFANAFAMESLQVAHAAYNINWVYGDKNVRHCVLLMIARSQKPLQLTTGGMQPLTMEVFQSILRVSYSYFSLLQGLI